MSKSQRTAACAMAIALGASLLTLSAPPSLADPNEPEQTLIGQGSADAPQAVTLINGDKVLVSTAADGTPSAVLPSERDYYSRIINKELYVFPVDAQGLISSGTLDPELFNLTGLIAQGYSDGDSSSLPVIVRGKTAQITRASGVKVTKKLESIDATALEITKDTAARTYEQLLGAQTRGANAAQKIWLDARVSANAESLDPGTGVAQTGAPEAWELGFDGTGTKVAVLDTGFDANHPDLKDQVLISKDFTGEGIADSQGHGTHVASTISGSGAADSSKVGMAPKAELLIGKVLGHNGGQFSGIISGMEWAVEQGADVVNMSLGSSEPTDCTDPMALATAQLTEQSHTLFVVAAGNAGARETISSPGCVEGVLTVAAVDERGEPASFTSRGSTLGAHTVKPDLAAPGVNIVGAQNGSPNGENYVAMSGTSMASPHVAGAAALLRQAHPEYTAQQLKAALVGSVKTDPADGIYVEGAGEMWLPSAIDTPVVSDVSVELADFDWPHGKDEVSTKPLTYTNSSDQAIKLNLKIEDLTGADGKSVPASMLKLSKHSITVPAHGTTTVELTATGHIGNLREEAYGEIGARVLATGAGEKPLSVVSSVGFWLEPKTVTVTISGIDRNGQAATSGMLDLTDMHQPARTVQYFDGKDQSFRVRVGKYFLTSFIRTRSLSGTDSYSYVGLPEAEFTEDTTVVLDARQAVPVSLKGDRPMEIRSGSLALERSWDDKWKIATSFYAQNSSEIYATGTDKVKNGTLTFGSYLRAYEPKTEVSESPYVYNLAFTEDGQVSQNQQHQVTDSSLAKVNEHWYAQSGQAWKSEEWTRVVPSLNEYPIYTSSGSKLAAPRDRTAYYTADVSWQQLAQSGAFNKFPEIWYDPVRTYAAGHESDIDWFKLPTNTSLGVNAEGTVGRVAERQGNLVGFSFAQWKDSVPGRLGLGGLADIGKMEVYQDGNLVDSSSIAGGVFEVSSEPSTLRVVLEQARIRRSEYWDLGVRTHTEFTFDSASPEGQLTQALPIALPLYDAEVNELNQAPRVEQYPVKVNLQGQDGYDPGSISKMSAEVSYERRAGNEPQPVEDYAWADTPVREQDGQWSVIVDNTVATDQVVSLRLTVEDAHGNKIRQVVEHLYGVQR